MNDVSWSFPNNPLRAAKWIAIVATERSEEFYKPTKNSVICSEHFDSNDIIGNTERRRLDKTAVPKYKIQSIPPEELTVRRKSRTSFKAQKTNPQDSGAIDEVDILERTSYNDQDIPPRSPSIYSSENESLSESLNDKQYLLKGGKIVSRVTLRGAHIPAPVPYFDGVGHMTRPAGARSPDPNSQSDVKRMFHSDDVDVSSLFVNT
ncbi:hypothetical protein RR48_09941 [Papilio machaon]|uniref:THAP-type domain-containing protein n=1 Tax=Papilio machaon TaxID=76193 RepID=A0A194RF20_PAPMA|nr:hypothetical protein RR48_09941 [Papilio machaon]